MYILLNMNNDTEKRFIKCAAEMLTVDESKIVPKARLVEDLNADSLDIIELVMALEDEFDVTVAGSELEGIDTVGKALDLINSKVG
jgi:acyl carrier protein